MMRSGLGRRRRGVAFAAALAAVAVMAAPASPAVPADTASATRDTWSGSGAEDTSPWFADGRPSPLALDALAVLDDARSHGLDPRDYAAAALRQAFETAARARPGTQGVVPPWQPRLQRALESALVRFLHDLHYGRIDPAALGWRFAPAARAPFDAEAVLRAALERRDLRHAIDQATPALPQYEQLRAALGRYRALAGHPAWAQPLPELPLPPPRTRFRALEPGQPWVGLPRLADRLAALGDLDAALAPPAAGAAYDGAWVAALQSFQQRHGLEPDGVLGRATLAALEVPPARRVRQIELALERLRWTPLRQGPRMIVVNVPEFVLRAYEVDGGRATLGAEMKVIVGQALDKRTPLILEEMRFIEFRPYWNVPPSIAREELVPRLRRDPAHWDREGFEFVGTGPAAAPADPVLSEAGLRATLAGHLRIRQRPGPRNALGDIKFVFPNREAIFLHHTPSTQLFERTRRDFSHGCIRVEDPVALAMFVLQGRPGWDEGRIRQAMGSDPPSTVTLAQPVPVLIAYGTALVKAGRVHFFDDIYGHDRTLEAALRHDARPPIAIAHRTPARRAADGLGTFPP
jgi:murein L,D-transpeptidase YcbB/YkuD